MNINKRIKEIKRALQEAKDSNIDNEIIEKIEKRLKEAELKAEESK